MIYLPPFRLVYVTVFMKINHSGNAFSEWSVFTNYACKLFLLTTVSLLKQSDEKKCKMGSFSMADIMITIIIITYTYV